MAPLHRHLSLAALIACCCLALAGCAGAKPAPSNSKPGADAAASKTGSSAASPAGGASDSDRTLYERLGGQPAIEAVVTDFIGNVAADERINAPFGVAVLNVLHQRLVEFVCVATGGPCKYTGRDMRAVHKGMGVTNTQFDALVAALVKSLDKFKVPEREKSELLGALGPLREQIVEAE